MIQSTELSNEVNTKVIEFASNFFKVDTSSINDTTSFNDDLASDAWQTFAFSLNVEKFFGIDIPMYKVLCVNTIGEYITCVREVLKETLLWKCQMKSKWWQR